MTQQPAKADLLKRTRMVRAMRNIRAQTKFVQVQKHPKYTIQCYEEDVEQLFGKENTHD